MRHSKEHGSQVFVVVLAKYPREQFETQDDPNNNLGDWHERHDVDVVAKHVEHGDTQPIVFFFFFFFFCF